MSITTLAAPATSRALSPGLLALLSGGAAVALARIVAAPSDGWAGVLISAVYGISLALGAILFLAIQAASGARWWRSFGHVPLALARALPVPVAALGLCFVLGLRALYPWARGEVLESNELLRAKAVWLNGPLFQARALVIVLIWFSFTEAFRSRLQALARGPSFAEERRLARTAVAFLVLFAVTISVASWDWTMSLEPEWFSTMYGVYVFAGTLLGGIAAVTFLCLFPRGEGLLRRPLSRSQRHDLGKLLFAFATFWAYVWFCQYMLIWYANLPEEAGHYVARLSGGWSMLFWLNPVLNFVVPFTALLSAGVKRHGPALLQVALLVLLGRWLDAYLLVAPALGRPPAFPLAALAATASVLAGMGLLLRRRWRAA